MASSMVKTLGETRAPTTRLPSPDADTVKSPTKKPPSAFSVAARIPLHALYVWILSHRLPAGETPPGCSSHSLSASAIGVRIRQVPDQHAVHVTENTAVAPPMLTASVRIALAAKPGERRIA